ncbi:hypothetical protein ACHAXR_011033 [Thalassiosira sp. AJA248-18]
MSSGNNNHSRKRPLLETEGASANGGDGNNNNNISTINNSRATHAQDFKRRQIQQSSWGFREVLAECGLLEFATRNNNGDGGDNDGAQPPPPSSSCHDVQQIGCQLDSTVSPSSLRSSLHALLSEMSKNGIDTNNERVLKDMEDIVLGTGDHDGGDNDDADNGENNTGGGGGGNNNRTRGSLLRRMLLPMYRIKTRQLHLSQFSQSPVEHEEGSNSNNNTKTVVESSSLIKVLLRIDTLQPTLVTALMQKLPELAASSHSYDENTTTNNNNTNGNNHNDSDIPRLIFSNLRWLDHIVDYPTFTNAYVECLTILASTSSSCQKTRGILLDAISALPDVLNDATGGGGSWMMGGDGGGGSEYNDASIENENDDDGDGELSSNPVLATLQHLRIEDPTLLIPCLDALGSLPLTDGQMESVTRDALEAMANVETWALPAITTFLMNHCPSGSGGGGGKGMAREVIEEMRKLPLGGSTTAGLDDDEEDGSMDLDENQHNTNTNNRAASSALMIESLSRGFAHRPDLTSTLLKTIKETPTHNVGYHPPADIWLLACCAVAPHNRPKVKSIFKSKANCGLFTSALVRQSLSGNGLALTSLFATSLCDLADGLLRSSSSSSSSLGGDSSSSSGASSSCELGVTLYQILFQEFGEPMQRQEIVGALVTHVGSGVGMKCMGEVDAALKVFCGIVDTIKKKKSSGRKKDEEDGAMALRPFTPFLTSMLDHLHHMTTGQVRRLFLLLFAVGGGDGDGDDGDLDGGIRGSACDIVIRKHLSLAPFAKKRIGIIGTVAYAVSRSSQLQEQQSIIDDENGMAETEATCLPGDAAVASSPITKEIKELIEEAYNHCKPAAGGGGNGSLGANHENSIARGHVVSSINFSVGSAFSDGSAMAFMLDELCHAVRGGRLAAPIREWLEFLFQSEFEDWYVGDFEDAPTQAAGTKGMKGDCITMLDPHHIPTDSTDLALLNGTSCNTIAPPGELRFYVPDSAECGVYVKLLPLLSSSDRTDREVRPVTLSAMFRLMSTLSDVRYGGKGLSEIDAMLECPLLLPTSECSGMEFEDLSAMTQWVVTGCYFFGTCWVRQLINSFIYAASGEGVGASMAASAVGGSFTSSSQGFNSEDVQKRIVARLKALVDLEEELRFTSSKCFVWAPPGLDLLPAPKELYDDDNCSYDNTENLINANADPKSMSKDDKKALTAAKKMATKRAKDKVKSKQKRLKAKQKHEEQLTSRTMGALRPLDPQACIALGFEELGVMKNAGGSQSQGLSQFQQDVTMCGGPVTTLLLKLLQKTLLDSLSEKKGGMAFKARLEGKGNNLEEEDVADNPYMAKEQSSSTNAAANFADIALASCEDSSKKCFAMLDGFLRGGVFAILYEHLAAVAELRCGPNRTNHDDAEIESQLVQTARCLFSCIKSLMESELLTRSTTGKAFLAAILKQIAEGDRNDYGSDNKRRRPTTATMNKLMAYVMDNVTEIVTGAYTGDLGFAMDGVTCMRAIFECSKRLSDVAGVQKNEDDDEDTPSFPAKLSEVADKLLRQHWPDDTKMNKGNIGVLLSLFVEHSPNRMETLQRLVNDVLSEVPHLDKGQGVAVFPTCSHHTFGSYYSTVLEYLVKELVSLFDSPMGKTKDPNAASRVTELVKEMIGLLNLSFNLTRDNDSLAKKSILLQQLKFGSRFIETFVSKSIPFFQVHFQTHEETILDIIRRLQKWSRQLYYIISHGKREKDANLAKEAPRAKKSLEMFIHKVKALLKKNRCMTAMWTKTLKAKDIDGTALKEEKELKEDEEEGDSASDDEDEADDSDEGDGDVGDSSENEYETDEN